MKEIFKAFNPNLTEDSLEILAKYTDIDMRIKNQKDNVSEVEALILERQSQLRNKIEEAEVKVSMALFGDKKFTRETYSLELPMTTDVFNGRVINGVLSPNPKVTKQSKPLETTIVSRRETDFKIVNGRLYLDKNTHYPYQEIELLLPKETGYFTITLDRFERLSVLNTIGKELVDTTITNTITLPLGAPSVVLRFEDNTTKSLALNLAMTSEVYEEHSTVETKSILVGKSLSEIAINTCDNYSSTAMRYWISINGGVWREVRPLNKHKNLELRSILAVDDDYHLVKLDASIDDRFVLDDLDSQHFHILKAFKGKLGDNIGSVPSTFTVFARESFEIDTEVLVNGTPSRIIPKGFSEVQVESGTWGQRDNLNRYRVLSVSSEVLLEDKETKERVKRPYYPSVFLQMITRCDIYTNEVTPESVYMNDTRYIRKESPELYMYIKYKQLTVDTVKVKIEMDAKSYLSSLTIRGV